MMDPKALMSILMSGILQHDVEQWVERRRSKRLDGSVVNLVRAHMVQVYNIAYGNICRTVVSLAVTFTFLLPV
jgi:hypothetical protein